MKQTNKITNNRIVIGTIILFIILATCIIASYNTGFRDGQVFNRTAYVAFSQVAGDVVCVNTGTEVSEFRKTNDFMKLMKQPYYVECRLQ